MAWDDHWQKLSWSWGIFSFGRAFSKHPEWGVDVSLNGWLVLILPQVMFFIWAYPLGNRNGLINKPQCMKREHCMCSAQAVFVKDNSPMLCLLEEGTRESGVCCIYPWAHPDAAREFHASAIRHKQLARLPGCQLLSVFKLKEQRRGSSGAAHNQTRKHRSVLRLYVYAEGLVSTAPLSFQEKQESTLSEGARTCCQLCYSDVHQGSLNLFADSSSCLPKAPAGLHCQVSLDSDTDHLLSMFHQGQAQSNGGISHWT